MEIEKIREIANAVLYEGYMLYPYRPSALKNRSQGWSFGTLLPHEYADSHPGEPDSFASEVIVAGGTEARISLELRFLQLARSGSERHTDAVERSVSLCNLAVADFLPGVTMPFSFPVDGGEALACYPVAGTMRVRAEALDNSLVKLSLSVRNESAAATTWNTREEALRQAMVSAHVLLRVSCGEFVSVLDPAETMRGAVASCKQEGVFPVLVGSEDERTAMLISPIILYDYPQIAAQSQGDFFDGTEIDEMLTLRVLTLTDDEKSEASASSGRVRDLLRRTESITGQAMLDLHGVMRADGAELEGWNPFAESKAPASVRVLGVDVKKGDRVRLRPSRQADIFDMALAGKAATVEAIEQTVEGEVQIAVTVDDDPGRDLGELRQVGHRFFFRADEIEPIDPGTRVA